jgi:hypothetical protein
MLSEYFILSFYSGLFMIKLVTFNAPFVFLAKHTH